MIGNGKKFVRSFQWDLCYKLCSKIYKVFENKMGHLQAWCCYVHRKLHYCDCSLWIWDRDKRYVSKRWFCTRWSSWSLSIHLHPCLVCVERHTSMGRLMRRCCHRSNKRPISSILMVMIRWLSWLKYTQGSAKLGSNCTMWEKNRISCAKHEMLILVIIWTFWACIL